MDAAPTEAVADAWVTYRMLHTAQMEALVTFIRAPTDEHEARYRDAAAGFRTAVYARDVITLEYMERMVTRAHIAALTVEESLQGVSGRLDKLEQNVDAVADMAEQRFDAVLANLATIRQQLTQRMAPEPAGGAS